LLEVSPLTLFALTWIMPKSHKKLEMVPEVLRFGFI
jgi:hypothetical protein